MLVNPTERRVAVATRRWVENHPGLGLTSAFAFGMLLCSTGLYWDRQVAPLMDDSDPSAAIGTGLLLFGLPALAVASLALAVKLMPWRLTRLLTSLVVAALVTEAVAITGLLVYELMFSRTLWSR
jgi:hypothetical protein